MTTLVLGATGATGRLLVQQLLEQGEAVRAVVRSTQSLPSYVTTHKKFSVKVANVLDLTDDEWAQQIDGCQAVISCLGHTLNFRGILMPPWRLVTEVTRRVYQNCEKQHRSAPIKFVLMNTTGNRNRDLDERISIAQHLVIGLLRVLLPPHADNESAADFLRVTIGQNNAAVEWVAVRPDGLINENTVTDFTVHQSPTRSAIFNAGTTSRINVADFMSKLILDPPTWQRWKGQMPVIYDNTPNHG